MKQWNFYTTNEIKPLGWLKRQLELQASGLNGNLDKVWPDVKSSAWIGGTKEGWERAPYWLDGFIPLAFLLDDKDKQERAKKYIDAILAAQEEDGWICPCRKEERKTYDVWAVFLITKVLTVYYQSTKDERIPSAVYRALKNLYCLLKNQEIMLFEWGKFRWFECLISISFIYERCHEEWLMKLAEILKQQGTNYPDLVDMWKRPINEWKLETHIVNLAMMLKYEAVYCNLTDSEYMGIAESLSRLLEEFNGTPTGIYTGDECLSGLSPIQGTELCSVVEQMYSYEWLFAVTGKNEWAEKLESLAFNALPATISDDMWSHQYDQMSNQIACIRFPGKPLFRTNNGEAHLFGLEPNFGCCTANFGQGWPKFALSAFMYRDNTILNVLPIPTELTEKDKRILVKTNYPFDNKVEYHIEGKSAFDFQVRLPQNADRVLINGTPAVGDFAEFHISDNETLDINVEFAFTPKYEKRPHDLYCVKYGPLVFSIPVKYRANILEYEKDGVERKYPYCDYEYTPEDAWNYAYTGDELTIRRENVGEIPFSSLNPPIMIRTKVKQIDWGLEDGYTTVCAKVPESRIPLSEAKEVSLYPYGCTRLRMTEVPII